MKQLLIVAGLVIAALVPGARAVSARQEHPIRLEVVIVRPGDTLWGIAGDHYYGDRRQRVYDLMQLNGLRSAIVVPGQRLQLPPR